MAAQTAGSDFTGVDTVESNTTSTSAFNAGNTGAEDSGSKGAPVLDQAKQQAQEVVQQTKEKAGEVISQVREQAKSNIVSQKDQAAGSLASVAQALRQTSGQLRDQQQGPAVGLVEAAASSVESLSGYLRDRDLDDIVREVEGFGRRQPVLFLGVSFALGFMAARFLKSSTPPSGEGSSRYLPMQTDYDAPRTTNYRSEVTTGSLTGASAFSTSPSEDIEGANGSGGTTGGASSASSYLG
jgi:hypothetical protein